MRCGPDVVYVRACRSRSMRLGVSRFASGRRCRVLFVCRVRGVSGVLACEIGARTRAGVTKSCYVTCLLRTLAHHYAAYRDGCIGSAASLGA